MEDPLAHPTRARLFRLLGELRRPAGTDELAERVGRHPNGVRVQLERLVEAGLVARERTRQARGRPRDMWSVAPDARPGGEAPSDSGELARWLARAVSPTRTTLRAVEAEGRAIGRELAGGGEDAGAEARLTAALAALGFQPERRGRDYRLGNCPYRDAVRSNQQLVCTLHRGMTRGLLDVISPKTELTGFVPRDPDEAGCLIELGGDLS